MKKRIIFFVSTFVFTALLTVSLSLYIEYQVKYSYSPHYSAEETSLNYDELFFDSGLSYIPTYSLGDTLEDMNITENERLEYEKSGFHIYKADDVITFNSLIQGCTYKLIEDVRGVMIASFVGKRNLIASFDINNALIKDDDSKFDLNGLKAISDQKNRVVCANIYHTFKHTYLIAEIARYSDYSEELQTAVPIVSDTVTEVFEIEASEALNSLISQKDVYKGGKYDYYSYSVLPVKALTIEVILCTLLIISCFALRKKGGKIND